MNKPLKSSETLKALSQDHHHGLLLCWKIRVGLKRGIDLKRIKAYAGWFYENHLMRHFEAQETGIFQLLGKEHPLIKRAIAEHRRLSRLFNDYDQILKSLSLIEEELENHIRFEERVLFTEIENTVSLWEVERLVSNLQHIVFIDTWADEFWK